MKQYKDFYELNDTSRESLLHLFIQRHHKARFDSPHADNILLEGVQHISTHEDREMIKQEREAFSFSYSSEVSEKEFASREIRRLNPLDVDDVYISERIESYLELCKSFTNEQQRLTFEDYLIIDPKKKQAFAENLKQHYDGRRSKAIALMIIALEDLSRLRTSPNAELYKAIRATFDSRIGSDQAINDFRNKHKQNNYFTPEEISRETGLIETLIPQ